MNTFTRFILFVLSLVFFGEVYFLSGRIAVLEEAPVIFWIFAGFATLRLAHTISYNSIAEWIRHPFTKTVQDTSGAGNSVEPKEGRLEAIGMLLSCPICSGTWAALFLLTMYSYNPRIGMVFAITLGLAGISEILHCLTESLEWTARDHREQAGSQWLLKNRGGYVGAFSQAEQEGEKQVA
jgi:hypothetical protein